MKESQKELRAQTATRLTGEQGKELRRRRAVDAETMLEDIRRNWHCTRFLMSGLKKEITEWGLICLGHDMGKLVRA